MSFSFWNKNKCSLPYCKYCNYLTCLCPVTTTMPYNKLLTTSTCWKLLLTSTSTPLYTFRTIMIPLLPCSLHQDFTPVITKCYVLPPCFLITAFPVNSTLLSSPPSHIYTSLLPQYHHFAVTIVSPLHIILLFCLLTFPPITTSQQAFVLSP